MVMALVSRLSMANLSDSWSFLVVHALLSQDEFQQEDSGRLVVRQEIDELQAEQLEFVPCRQVLQDEDNINSRKGEGS